jgi:hypothetical protein
MDSYETHNFNTAEDINTQNKKNSSVFNLVFKKLKFQKSPPPKQSDSSRRGSQLTPMKEQRISLKQLLMSGTSKKTSPSIMTKSTVPNTLGNSATTIKSLKSFLGKVIMPEIIDSIREGKESSRNYTGINLPLLTNTNEHITAKERNFIKKMTTKLKDKEIIAHKTLKDEFKSINLGKKDSNLIKLKKLVLKSPYQDVPASVKFSITSDKQLEHYYIPTIQGSSMNKEGNLCKHVNAGSSTILFKKNLQKDNLMHKLLHLKENDSTITFKKSIRWKNLKWLLTYKAIYIDLLIDSYKDMQVLLRSRKGKLTQPIFEEIVSLINTKNLKKDRELSDNIFIIFDDDRDGLVDFNEMLVGLIFFRKGEFNSKINTITDICISEGKVDVGEFIRLVRTYIFNKKDIKRLSDLLKTLTVNDAKVTKRQFIEFIVNNEEIKFIFSRSMENVSEHEAYLEDEINNFCKSNLKRSK